MEEIGSAQLTAAYVEQLRVALKLKNDECQELHESNLELRRQLADQHEEMKELETKCDFEASRADLAMSCNKISADPSHVVRIVSSWLPESTDATMACCVKVGDAWIVVEEKTDSQRMSHSTLLDDIVLYNDEINGDGPAVDIIPESVLHSLGWSHSHESLAISLYSRCVWVIIGVGAKEAARVALGFHSVLATATELIMSSVVHQMEKTAEVNRLCRIETSLEMCRLLLSASYLTPSCRSISTDRRVLSDGSSSEMCAPVTIWRDLPRAIGVCIEDVDCDILLFHRDGHGGTTVISAINGAWYRPSLSTASGSLTEKAIVDGTELLVCCDPHNISRDFRIDCGLDHKTRESDTDDNAHHPDYSCMTSVTSIAVAPIWTDSPRHTVTHPLTGSSLINVSGAVVFRLRDRSFTEAEVNVMMEVVSDNFGVLRDWMNSNVCEVIRVLGADGATSPEGEPATGTAFISTTTPGSPACTLSSSGIAKVRHSLEWYLNRGTAGFAHLAKSSLSERQALVNLLARSFSCEWAVLLQSNVLSEVVGDEHKGSGAVGSVDMLLVDDLGHSSNFSLETEGVNTDLLSQSIKCILSYHNSIRAGRDIRHKAADEYNKKTCVVLNNFLGSFYGEEDCRDSMPLPTSLLNSLLNSESLHRSMTRLNNPLSALVPMHVMCTSLRLRSLPVSCDDEPDDEYVVILAGRKWDSLKIEDILTARHELQQILGVMDDCREKDTLLIIADELSEQLKALEETTELRKRYDEALQSFETALTALSNSETFASGLLRALDESKSVVFGHDSVIMVCINEEITKKQWVLSSNTKDRAQWLPLDRQFALAVEWRDLNLSQVPRDQNVILHRTLNVVTNNVTGRTLSSYHICPLYTETAASVCLDMCVVIFCPFEAAVDSLLVSQWDALLTATVLPRAHAFLHQHRSSCLEFGGNCLNTLRSSSTYTAAIAAECVTAALSDHSWMDCTISPLAGRFPLDSVSAAIRSNSIWSNMSYLCSISLWQRLVNYCDCPVRVAVPAIAVPMRKGTSSGREYFMIDMLRCDHDMPTQLQEALHKSVSSAGSGDIDYCGSVTSREHRASLSEVPHCVHRLDNGKTMVQIFSGRSGIGELVYRYLLNCNDLQEFVPQDNVILLSHIICEVPTEAPCYVHMILVAQAKYLVTPYDLATLECVLSTAFTPLDIIRAHDCVKSDIRLMRDMVLGDSRVKAQETVSHHSVSSKLFQKQHSSDWSAAHAYTEKTVANMLHLSVASAQSSASEINSPERGQLSILDGAAYLFDGSDLVRCSESVATAITTPKRKGKPTFPDTIEMMRGNRIDYDSDHNWDDQLGEESNGSGNVRIYIMPFSSIYASRGHSVDDDSCDEDEVFGGDKAASTKKRPEELLRTGTYVIRVSITEPQQSYEPEGDENELAVILIRGNWDCGSVAGGVAVDDIISRHGRSQLRLLALTAMQTLVRDNTLREAHGEIVLSYNSRMNDQRGQSVQCVSRIDAALSTILSDTVGIAEIFQSLQEDKTLQQRVAKERGRRDSLVSYFDVEGDVVISDERHAKMIENCFGDIERKTELIRKAICAAKETIEAKTHEINYAKSDITGIKTSMNGVQTQLSDLEVRHVSFVEHIISSVETFEQVLHISDGRSPDADWSDENSLYNKLKVATSLSAFYYNALQQLIEHLKDKGLVGDTFNYLNGSSVLSMTRGADSDDPSLLDTAPDIWSMLWLPPESHSAHHFDALHGWNDLPASADVVNPEALKQAILSRQLTTSRITARSNFNGDAKYQFVSYWPVVESGDSQPTSISVVLQQVHELESSTCSHDSSPSSAVKEGLFRIASHLVGGQCPQHLTLTPVRPDWTAHEEDSLVLSARSLAKWGELFMYADSGFAGLELSLASACGLIKSMVELLTNSLSVGSTVGVFVRYSEDEDEDEPVLRYASCIQRAGREFEALIEHNLSREVVFERLGRDAVAKERNTAQLSFSSSILKEHARTDGALNMDSKVFRLMESLSEKHPSPRRASSANTWLHLVVESNQRLRSSHIRLVEALFGTLENIRSTLQCRHDVSTAEKSLVGTNESLVNQLALSEKFLSNLNRKNMQWQSCCTIVASLPEPPRVDTTLRKGRVFSPTPSKETRHRDDFSEGDEDSDNIDGEDRAAHDGFSAPSWHYVWEGDAITDRKRIIDRLKTTFTRLKPSFEVAVSGMESVEVEVCRIDSSTIADVRQMLQEERSSDGTGGIYPFSQNAQSLVTLTVSAEGRVVRGHSDLSSTATVTTASVMSMTLSRVGAMALVSNAIIEAPEGVKGDSRPCAVVPVGAFTAPLDGWILLLRFNDVAAWDAYVSSNVASASTDDEGCSEHIYQNAVWLVKVLRQWLRGIESEREDKQHRKALRYVRGVSAQAYQAITAMKLFHGDGEVVDIPSAAAAVEIALGSESHRRRGGENSSPLKTTWQYSDLSGKDLGEYMSALCTLHEDGFDDNIVCGRLHWREQGRTDPADSTRGQWHTVSSTLGSDSSYQGSPLKAPGRVKWSTQYSAASSQQLQRAIEQGVAVDCVSDKENEPTKQHAFKAIVIFLSISDVSQNDVVMELTLKYSRTQVHERLLKSALCTDGDDCFGVLSILTEFVGEMLRSTLHSTQLSRSLKTVSTEESRHSSRLHVIVRCLQELHAPKGHLVPVVRATEKVLAALPGCKCVKIHCVDDTDGHVLYSQQHMNTQYDASDDDSRRSPHMETGPDDVVFNDSVVGWYKSNDSLDPFNMKALRPLTTEADGNFTYELQFQVYEVKGSVILNTCEHLCDMDKVIMQALVKATGRRIYELYRGQRHKKAYAELQRNFENISRRLKQRDIEVQDANRGMAALRDELQEALTDSERLKGLLRSEGAALEAARKMKRDGDKHYKRVLDECRSEFERKEHSLNKTLDALKRQCETLRSQLLQESKGQAVAAEDLKSVSDKAMRIDRKRKELEAELASCRGQYEARIRDLQNQLSQYQNEILTMEREHALGEEKLKSACQISEERVKTAHERMHAMEQEVAATRSSTLFLKQQLDASSRALKMSQDELERHKIRVLSAAQSEEDAGSDAPRNREVTSSTRQRVTAQSSRKEIRRVSRMSSSR